MNVVHVGTTISRGGASIAMQHLHTGLLREGINSHIIAMQSQRTDNPSEYIISTPQIQEAKSRIDFIESQYCWSQRTAQSNTHFTLDLDAYTDLAEHPLIQSADVIHLHWISGFISSQSLLKLVNLNKPIFWTLHDIRPLTGGCHFPAGCDNFTTQCESCPQIKTDPAQAIRYSHDILKHAANTLSINYIAPSRWIMKCAQSSAVASKQNCYHIPYGIDARHYAPVNKEEARKNLGLQPDTKYILLAANNFLERRKGLHLAKELLLNLSKLRRENGPKLRIACFGESSNDANFEGFEVDRLGYLDTTEKVCIAYSACDLLLFTSEEDNLPNVILEAMLCGLPIAGFTIGGVPDIVENHETGLLLDIHDLQESAKIIDSTLLSPNTLEKMSQKCRASIIKRFTLEAQARTTLELYRDKSSIQKEARYFNEPVLSGISHSFQNAIGNAAELMRENAFLKEALQKTQLILRTSGAVIPADALDCSGIRSDGWCGQVVKLRMGSCLAGDRVTLFWGELSSLKDVDIIINIPGELNLNDTLNRSNSRTEFILKSDHLNTELTIHFSAVHRLSPHDNYLGSARLIAAHIGAYRNVDSYNLQDCQGIRPDGWCETKALFRIGPTTEGDEVVFFWGGTASNSPIQLSFTIENEPSLQDIILPQGSRSRLVITKARLETTISAEFSPPAGSSSEKSVPCAQLTSLHIQVKKWIWRANGRY